MLRTVVEGEPGVFPEPVARIMRGIGGLFRRASGEDAPDAASPSPGSDTSSDTPFDPSTLDPSRPDDGPDDAPGDEADGPADARHGRGR